MPGPLQVTQHQAAAIPALDAALQQAYADGVSGDADPDLIKKIDGYTDFTPLQQTQLKQLFENVAAATMVVLNLIGSAMTITGAAPVAKVTLSGTDGSLTFTEGRLTTKVDPT